MTKARRIADIGRQDEAVNIEDLSLAALVERTAYGNGTDITPLIEAAGELLQSRSVTARGRIIIPAGKWRMGSSVDSDRIAGCYIEGAGAQATLIYYDASNGTMFHFDGENTSIGWSGGGLSKMRLILGAQSLGGGSPVAIKLKGTNVGGFFSEPDGFHLDNVYVNAEDPNIARWFNGFFANGTDRHSPQGIRVATLRDLQVFDCTNLGIYMSAIVQWSIENIGTYTGTGTGNDIHITGGGITLEETDHVSARLVNCGGTLNISNCTNVDLTATCGGLAIGNAKNCYGYIVNSGATNGAFSSNSDVKII